MDERLAATKRTEERLTCPACGRTVETVDDLDTKSVPEISKSSGRHITLGANLRDLWLCKGCGNALGVKR